MYGLEEREGEVAIWLAAVTDLYIRARRQTRLFISSDRANQFVPPPGFETHTVRYVLSVLVDG